MPASPTPAPTEEPAMRFHQALSVTVLQAGLDRPVPKVQLYGTDSVLLLILYYSVFFCFFLYISFFKYDVFFYFRHRWVRAEPLCPGWDLCWPGERLQVSLSPTVDGKDLPNWYVTGSDPNIKQKKITGSCSKQFRIQGPFLMDTWFLLFENRCFSSAEPHSKYEHF